jgi:hypothetical protein
MGNNHDKLFVNLVILRKSPFIVMMAQLKEEFSEVTINAFLKMRGKSCTITQASSLRNYTKPQEEDQSKK